MRSVQDKIELFKKIADIHFATDYSSIDYLYPPLFIWHKNRPADKIQKGLIFSRIEAGNYNLYIHFPFCRYKCAFCRQFSVIASEKHYEDYIDLLSKELKLYAPYFGHSRLVGMYFGGGTPTLFNLEKVLKTIYANFNLCSPFYLNIESTPDSISKTQLKNLKKLGLTRLLIGVQSFDPKVLRIIGRPENQLKIFEKIYGESRQIGIPYINVELICGLPGQSHQSFIKDLNYVIGLKPDSIHIYPYIQTPLTILGKKYGPLSDSSKVSITKMHLAGCKILEKAGYIFRGDDFAPNDDGRNPSYNASSIFYRHQGVLAVGMSSLGFYPLFGGDRLRTFNTLNFEKYAKLISKRLLPVEKFYHLNSQEERLRQQMIKFCRYGGFSASDLLKFKIFQNLNFRKLLLYFQKEFAFLQSANKVKIDKLHSRVDFGMMDWVIDSKIFYSRKILKRCQNYIMAMEDK